MSASAAFAPRGTLFQHSNNGLTWTTVAEVSKIQTTGSKADLADVTNFDSGVFREFLPTLLDSGEVTLDCNLIPGNTIQQLIETEFNTQVLGYYMIVLPSSLGQAQFRAYVSSKDFDLPLDKQATRQIKLKITGAMTVTW